MASGPRKQLSRREFVRAVGGVTAAGVVLPAGVGLAQEIVEEEVTAAPVVPPVGTFRGNASRSLQGVGTVPRKVGVLWSFDTGELAEEGGGVSRGTGCRGPAASSDGRVYVPGLDGVCYCRDAITGEAIWETRVGGAISSSITLWYDQLLFGSRDDHLHCLMMRDGTERWRLACGAKDVDSTPAVIEGRAWFGTGDARMYCVNAGGEVLWSYTAGGALESSPSVADGRVYVGCSDGYLHCVRASDGERMWTFPTGDDTPSSPVVVGDRVYVGSRNGFLYAVDRVAGTRVWRYRAGAGIVGTPAVVDGRVFVGADDAVVHCVKADEGSALWRTRVASGMAASPTVLDGMLVVGDRSGALNALEAESGAWVWTHEAGASVVSSACIAGGRIYVGSLGGTFYCLGEGGA